MHIGLVFLDAEVGDDLIHSAFILPGLRNVVEKKLLSKL